MPLHEYRCRKCGATIEKIEKFSDPPLDSCDNCGGKLEQLLSSPAIQFKGSGWYVTDYARKSSGSAGPPSASSTSSASDAKKEPVPTAPKPSSDSK